MRDGPLPRIRRSASAADACPVFFTLRTSPAHSPALLLLHTEPAKPRTSRSADMQSQHTYGSVPGYLQKMKSNQLEARPSAVASRPPDRPKIIARADSLCEEEDQGSLDERRGWQGIVSRIEGACGWAEVLSSVRSVRQPMKRMSTAGPPKNERRHFQYPCQLTCDCNLCVPELKTHSRDLASAARAAEAPVPCVKTMHCASQMLDTLKREERSRMQAEQERMKMLGTSDRAAILKQLKSKWDHVNEQYQKGSTLDLKKLDTMGKVRRKENYENQLQTLESYIDRLTAKRHVFISA